MQADHTPPHSARGRTCSTDRTGVRSEAGRAAPRSPGRGRTKQRGAGRVVRSLRSSVLKGPSGPGGEGHAGWEEMCGRGINRLFDGETTSGKANGGDRRAARCQGVRARRRAMLGSSNGSDAPGWEQDRQVAVIRRHILFLAWAVLTALTAVRGSILSTLWIADGGAQRWL